MGQGYPRAVSPTTVEPAFFLFFLNFFSKKKFKKIKNCRRDRHGRWAGNFEKSETSKSKAAFSKNPKFRNPKLLFRKIRNLEFQGCFFENFEISKSKAVFSKTSNFRNPKLFLLIFFSKKKWQVETGRWGLPGGVHAPWPWSVHAPWPWSVHATWQSPPARLDLPFFFRKKNQQKQLWISKVRSFRKNSFGFRDFEIFEKTALEFEISDFSKKQLWISKFRIFRKSSFGFRSFGFFEIACPPAMPIPPAIFYFFEFFFRKKIQKKQKKCRLHRCRAHRARVSLTHVGIPDRPRDIRNNARGYP